MAALRGCSTTGSGPGLARRSSPAELAIAARASGSIFIFISIYNVENGTPRRPACGIAALDD